MPKNDRDDFFIGWNPPSYRDARWLRMASLSLIAGSIVFALILSVFQRDPGTGSWQDDQTAAIEGLVVNKPYAMLRTTDAKAASGIRTIMLVSEGKFGATDRVSSFHGKYVRVRGTYLHRNDCWMMELVGGSDAIIPVQPPTNLDLSSLDPPEELIGSLSVQGEIIDPKCYLGAMKPGEGKTHKACASLCISGGIPPMLVSSPFPNGHRYLLLVSTENQPVNAWAARLAGESVVLAGQLARSGDLNYFKIALNPSTSEKMGVPTKE